jgi:8-oxo-dGTP pyrophosphatase MutT (NUDIX family)
MTRRPDLVDVWPFRVKDGVAELLLLRRSSDNPILPGLWQGVSGLIEPDEHVVDAALREVAEETGFSRRAIVGFYHLDYAAEFLWQPLDALMTSAYFALRVGPDVDPVLSDEHDSFRWVAIDDVSPMLVWPAYREAVARIASHLLDPALARWMEIPAEGSGNPG